VRECCVVGFEEEHGLTTALAYVAVNAGHAEGPELAQRLIDHAKARLLHYKAPRRVEFMASLPRNDRGKISRAELRKRADAAAPKRARDLKTAQP
jgi:acyl-coenzyme A synthetase/AMP-(fatty) acid ligase